MALSAWFGIKVRRREELNKRTKGAQVIKSESDTYLPPLHLMSLESTFTLKIASLFPGAGRASI